MLKFRKSYLSSDWMTITQFLICMSIAVTRTATGIGGRISITPHHTFFTIRSFGVVVAFIANADSILTA